jgi:hypothetical protein
MIGSGVRTNLGGRRPQLLGRGPGGVATLLLAAGLLAACSGGIGLPTGPAVTPTPTPRPVTFSAPYRAVLHAGESVPGAPLMYVGPDDRGIHVRIEGQDAYKKVGDSFNWRGSPAVGVELDYRLRVIGVVLDVFQAWGNVEIVVPDPHPAVADLRDGDPLVFPMAVTTLEVAKGQPVPGTTYSYLGKTDSGAEFGGVEGYPYRQLADSLTWKGQLRTNVHVDLTLRVSSIREDRVTLVGTGTVSVFP